MEANKITMLESVANSAAFPMNFEFSGETKDGIPAINTKVAFGLTKREMMVMSAMKGLISGGKDITIPAVLEEVAKKSIDMADELLKQLYPETQHPH